MFAVFTYPLLVVRCLMVVVVWVCVVLCSCVGLLCYVYFGLAFIAGCSLRFVVVCCCVLVVCCFLLFCLFVVGR